MRVRQWALAVALIIGVIAVDQATKEAIIQRLARYESMTPIPFLGDVFRFTHSYNTGAAFGLLPDAGNLFLILAITVVIGMLLFYHRIPPEAHITRMSIALICGGALGNVIDRLQHGHVTDFIHYTVPGVSFSNISNLADHAIVIGVILVIIESWRLERRTQQAISTADTPSAVETDTSPDNAHS